MEWKSKYYTELKEPSEKWYNIIGGHSPSATAGRQAVLQCKSHCNSQIIEELAINTTWGVELSIRANHPIFQGGK